MAADNQIFGKFYTVIFGSFISSFRYQAVCLSEFGREKLKAAAYKETAEWMFITRLEYVDQVEIIEDHKDFKTIRNTKQLTTLDLKRILSCRFGYSSGFPDSLEIIPYEDIRFKDKLARTPKHFINSQGVKAVLEAQEVYTYADGPEYDQDTLLSAKMLIDRIEIDESFERLLKLGEEYSYPLGIGHPNGFEYMLKLKPRLHISWLEGNSKKQHKAEFKGRFKVWVVEKSVFQQTSEWLASIRWLVWIFVSLSLGLTIFWKGLPFKEIFIIGSILFIGLWVIEIYLKSKKSKRLT